MVERQCEWCGEKFYVWPSIVKRGGGRFCSRDCWGESNKGENHPQWKGGKVKKPCLQCGEIFETWPFKIRDGEGKFCSILCRSQWASENTSGENSWHWERITVQCKQCGESFSVEPALLTKGRGKFCSQTCRYKWQSENMRGENGAHWKGGKSFSPYSPEWTDKLKEEIRKRDDHTCAISGEVWQVGQDKFPVHHVDYDKTNNDLNNLITLSPSSHARTNGNRRHWQVLLSPIARGAEMRANAFVEGFEPLLRCDFSKPLT